jgi:hypothetical protein
VILTIKSVLKKQMIKEFALVFSLMLFMIATYYVIQFAHGKTSTYTGVVSIISLLVSFSYPMYYFSDLNSGHREEIFDTLFPVGAIVDRAVGQTNAAVDAGTQHALVGTVSAASTYAAAYTLSLAAAPYVPALAGILGGPLGWFLLPLIAFLVGVSRKPGRDIVGGKRSKKRV